MFCNICGNRMPEMASQCPCCGASYRPAAVQRPAPPAQNLYAQSHYPQRPVYPVSSYAASPYAANVPGQSSVGPGSVLTFGILALVFACTLILSALGIVFGAIARSRAYRYLRETGRSTGQVTTGRILGTIGLVLGIVICAIYGTQIFLEILSDL